MQSLVVRRSAEALGWLTMGNSAARSSAEAVGGLVEAVGRFVEVVGKLAVGSSAVGSLAGAGERSAEAVKNRWWESQLWASNTWNHISIRVDRSEFNAMHPVAVSSDGFEVEILNVRRMRNSG